MSNLIGRAEPGSLSHPLMTTRPVKKAELLVITSDRGLAGGFNANITRRALKWVQEQQAAGVEVTVTTVGRKGNEFLRGRGVSIRKDNPGLLQKLSYAAADAIAKELSARFLNGEVDAVFVMFNEFVSAIAQVPTTAQLLPFEAKVSDSKSGGSLVDYKYEPNPQAVLETLVPQAVAVKVYRGLLESFDEIHTDGQPPRFEPSDEATIARRAALWCASTGRQASVMFSLNQRMKGMLPAPTAEPSQPATGQRPRSPQ